MMQSKVYIHLRMIEVGLELENNMDTNRLLALHHSMLRMLASIQVSSAVILAAVIPRACQSCGKGYSKSIDDGTPSDVL